MCNSSNSFYTVINMDSDMKMLFHARTAHEALSKLIYTLNLKHMDKNAKINLSASARYLWTEHNGETWAVSNANKTRRNSCG